MALEIRDIPVLTGETAERFVEEAERNAREGHVVTFPEEFVRSVERMMECSRKIQRELDERIRRGETIVFQ